MKSSFKVIELNAPARLTGLSFFPLTINAVIQEIVSGEYVGYFSRETDASDVCKVLNDHADEMPEVGIIPKER